MSNGALKVLAGAGATSDPVYVDDVFSTFLYDGTGSSLEINNGMDLSGQGGLVWIKGRNNTNATQDHRLVDTERGVNEAISSSTNDNVLGITGEFTSFDNDGFTLASTSGNGLNRSGEGYCSWTFRNQPGFFEVVKYEGNGTAGRTVSHNLGSAPGCMIVKAAETGVGFNGDFLVYHRGNTAAPETERLFLNSNAATSDSSSFWNDTAPTATEFTLGSSTDVNKSGVTYIAYLFAHDDQSFGENSDEAIIKCGGYTTDSSGNATIDLGFEPQFIFAKRADGTGDWFINDVMRGIVTDGNDPYLVPNSSAAENSSYDYYDLTPTGFKHEGGFTSSTYIYIAIRRPHKPAEELGATGVFSVKNYAATTSSASVTHDIAFDMEMNGNRDATISKFLFLDHLRGINGKALKTSDDGAEVSYPAYWSRKNQFTMYAPSSFDAWWASSSGTQNHISYAFKRAPGFFDIVAYRGQSAEMSVTHNLGVTPELIIQKCRTQGSGYAWNSWYTGLTNSQYINFNGTTGYQTSNQLWGTNSTVATDSIFRVGASNTGVNGGSSNTHVAYLFASVNGISKVGTFSHTNGSTTDVDCGFSAGARFVLVKRVDSGGGHWVVVDSVRGINAGNDPYLLFSSTAAEVTNLDIVDPLSSGFQMQGYFATGTWLFLAIA